MSFELQFLNHAFCFCFCFCFFYHPYLTITQRSENRGFVNSSRSLRGLGSKALFWLFCGTVHVRPEMRKAARFGQNMVSVIGSLPLHTHIRYLSVFGLTGIIRIYTYHIPVSSPPTGDTYWIDFAVSEVCMYWCVSQRVKSKSVS